VTFCRRLWTSGFAWFPHDFRNVTYQAPKDDNNPGTPDLHTVYPVVEPRERPPANPPDLFTKYDKTHFWAKTDPNLGGARIL
jgi:sulfotransferase